MKNRVAEVNKALKARGVPERLRAGRGYYYFWEGSAPGWYRSSVTVFSASALSVKQWLEEYDTLANEAKAMGRY
jgi:hypothetical protein